MTTEKKAPWPLIIGATLAGVCLCGCICILGFTVLFPTISQRAIENSALSIGQQAPDFEAASLDGQTIALSQFRGQPVVLTIGATWCPDCKKQAPLLQKVHEMYPDLVILDVDSKESAELVQNYADETGLTYTFLLDPEGEIMRAYQIIAIPTTFFIDTDGIIQDRLIEQVTEESIEAGLRKIGVTD